MTSQKYDLYHSIATTNSYILLLCYEIIKINFRWIVILPTTEVFKTSPPSRRQNNVRPIRYTTAHCSQHHSMDESNELEWNHENWEQDIADLDKMLVPITSFLQGGVSSSVPWIGCTQCYLGSKYEIKRRFTLCVFNANQCIKHKEIMYWSAVFLITIIDIKDCWEENVIILKFMQLESFLFPW